MLIVIRLEQERRHHERDIYDRRDIMFARIDWAGTFYLYAILLTMEKEMTMHALAILEAAKSWVWPGTSRIQASEKISGRFKAITPKLLSAAIIESQALGGTLLDQFWDVVSQCHPGLAENSRSRLPL